MKWFNNLRVAYKVMLSCAVLIILMVTAIFFSISSMNATKEAVQDYRNNSVLAVIKMDGIIKNLLQARTNMLVISIAVKEGNNEEIKKRLDETAAIRDDSIQLLKYIKEREMTQEEKALTDKFEAENLLLVKKMAEFADAIKTANTLQIETVMNDWVVQFRMARDVLQELHALGLKNGAGKITAGYADMDRVIIYLFIILAFSFLMGVVITVILSRSVSGPVRLGLEFAQKLAEGDFTERIDINQEDELGMLAKALNTAADNLEKLVSEVSVSVQNLTYAVNDISEGNQNLSQRTTEQASSLEEIASTLEEATASIRQNSDNTVQANKIADTSSRLAEDGGKIVESTVISINQISESGKKIGEIIAVINEIAFQTNLLALNAAVEAARAGEQGRGFAVVASEVRNLAQRAGNSAKEIETLIKDSIEKIEQGTEFVNRSGESLREIIASVKQVGRIISEVTAATEEQKQGIDQINIAVMELDTMTQQNSALVEETASASEEMSGQAQDLMEMMTRFTIRKDEKTSGSVIYESKMKNLAKPAVKKTTAAQVKSAAAPAKKVTVTKETSDSMFERDGFEKF